jgi:hypothetical protein
MQIALTQTAPIKSYYNKPVSFSDLACILEITFYRYIFHSYIFEISRKFCVIFIPIMGGGGVEKKIFDPSSVLPRIFVAGRGQAQSIINFETENETTAGCQDSKKIFIKNQLTLLKTVTQRNDFKHVMLLLLLQICFR